MLRLTIIGGNSMKDYRKAKKQIDVTVGESVKIIRELQELIQNELAELTGIPQSTISAIENDRVQLGVERAKVLARASTSLPSFSSCVPRLGYRARISRVTMHFLLDAALNAPLNEMRRLCCRK